MGDKGGIVAKSHDGGPMRGEMKSENLLPDQDRNLYAIQPVRNSTGAIQPCAHSRSSSQAKKQPRP